MRRPRRRKGESADCGSEVRDCRLQFAFSLLDSSLLRSLSSVQSQSLSFTSTGQHCDAVVAGVADELGRGVEAHRLAVDQRGGEGGRVIVLEPGRDVDQQGEAGGVRFGEAVLAEAANLLEDAARRTRRCRPLARMPSSSFSRNWSMTPGRRQAAIARRSWSASPGVKPAATTASRIACSWKSGTPSVLCSTCADRVVGIRRPASSPLRRRRYGCTMLPWIGPGRTIATSITRS